MFNDEVKEQLKDILVNMKDEVYALYFESVEDEGTQVTKAMLEDISNITDKFKVEYYSLDSQEAKIHNIDKNGGLTLLEKDKKVNGIKFYGPPAGYEINSFIHTILDLSHTQEEKIEEEILERIKKINKKIDIKVFVGLQCPHCPGAVISAHTLAKLNENIQAEMVEASIYNELSKKFAVSSVPRIIINDGVGDLLGNQPVEELLKAIENI